MNGTVTVELHAEVDLSVLMRQAGAFLRRLGLDAEERDRLLTVAMELARNILKYARTGLVRLSSERRREAVVVRVEATDRGPGIADVALALTDRYSTGGSLGLGLPGVRRMVDRMEIESVPGNGTRVLAERCVTPRSGGRS